VQGEYNITTAGFRNAQQHGITPLEIFEVLDCDVRLFRRVGDQSMVVAGPTNAGRHLVILVTEADLEPDVWDIVAAREMSDQEITSYRKAREGGPR
jgi:uncharacterized DUF497 family protein